MAQFIEFEGLSDNQQLSLTENALYKGVTDLNNRCVLEQEDTATVIIAGGNNYLW
jgi:hypothetical protein